MRWFRMQANSWLLDSNAQEHNPAMGRLCGLLADRAEHTLGEVLEMFGDGMCYDFAIDALTKLIRMGHVIERRGTEEDEAREELREESRREARRREFREILIQAGQLEINFPPAMGRFHALPRLDPIEMTTSDGRHVHALRYSYAYQIVPPGRDMAPKTASEKATQPVSTVTPAAEPEPIQPLALAEAT